MKDAPTSEAVILAGGKGTRLQQVLNGRPKALVDVLGEPLLERQLRELARFGYSRVTLLVGHEAEALRRYCVRHPLAGVELRIIEDRAPRGTAGAFLDALDRFGDDVLVVYGDLLFRAALDRFFAFHSAKPDAAATLMLHPSDHPLDADIVEMGDNNAIRTIHGYPHPPDAWLPNLVSAAVYWVRPRFLRAWRARFDAGVVDFAKHLFPAMLGEGALLRGYVTGEFVRDIGTPDRLRRASAAFARGTAARASLEHPQSAVFLDRDGTLVRLNGHIREPEALELLPGAIDAVRLLHAHEYRNILVTNQPVLARGECTEAQLRRIHDKLETLLGRQGALLDRIYYCPHHPDGGFAGEVAELKRACDCRKPQPGLLYRARADFNVDMARSWMIGDSTTDCEAAARAGVTGILLVSEREWPAVAPRCSGLPAADVGEAARFIASVYPVIAAVLAPLVNRVEVLQFFVAGEDACARARVAEVLAKELRLSGRVAEVRRLAEGAERQRVAARGAPNTCVVWEGKFAAQLAASLGCSDDCVIASADGESATNSAGLEGGALPAASAACQKETSP